MKKCASTMNQEAKIRLSLQVDKAKHQREYKDEEVFVYQAVQDHKLTQEGAVRRAKLINTVSNNLKMKKDVKGKRSLERVEFLAEKNHIQTSVQSQKQLQTIEQFKRRLNQDKLMDATMVNNKMNKNLARSKNASKDTELKWEKEWVNSSIEKQRFEDQK